MHFIIDSDSYQGRSLHIYNSAAFPKKNRIGAYYLCTFSLQGGYVKVMQH